MSETEGGHRSGRRGMGTDVSLTKASGGGGCMIADIAVG